MFLSPPNGASKPHSIYLIQYSFSFFFHFYCEISTGCTTTLVHTFTIAAFLSVHNGLRSWLRHFTHAGRFKPLPTPSGFVRFPATAYVVRHSHPTPISRFEIQILPTSNGQRDRQVQKCSCVLQLQRNPEAVQNSWLNLMLRHVPAAFFTTSISNV